MHLRELKTPLSQIKGVGPRLQGRLAKLGLQNVGEALLFIPREYEDRKTRITLQEGVTGRPVNTLVKVLDKSYFGYGAKRTLKIIVTDNTAQGSLVCFGRNFLDRQIQIGEDYYLYGSFQVRFGELQCSSFEVEPAQNKGGDKFGRILPLYPLTEGINQGQMRKIMSQVVREYAGPIEEEIPHPLRSEHDLYPFAQALKEIHFPRNPESFLKARKTLVYWEFFLLEMGAAYKRHLRRSMAQEDFPLDASLQNRLIDSLPFDLTPDQKAVLKQINQDIASTAPMNRLVQGDVGSGKTLVAFLSALGVIPQGKQVAFMAPTELLAQQHGENAVRLLGPLGVRVAFLSGKLKTPQRKILLEKLREGEIDLLVGTHALFSSDVVFRELRLVIVDEQHRFGVMQRQKLQEKGMNPDILLMTATPIPRTLALTAFGDLDTSLIQTMPKGRKPIETHLSRMGNEEKVYQFLQGELNKGRQVYFVYPLVEQSEKMDLKDAETMYHRLQQVFENYRCGLIHSRVGEEEKEATMKAFTENHIQILVATSVVEVGVDVPNATCMVIEHSERFGLSTLHQLRGRVGRSELQSYAFLVYNEPLSEEGILRLKIMKETTDGFAIAQEDLKIRGPGELTGIRQSGFLNFKIADITRDADLLVKARRDAFELINRDPGGIEPENHCLLWGFSNNGNWEPT